jgi:hypothetical protein
MDDAVARADRYADAALRLSPPVQPLACGKGCRHCCWATAGVVAPDALYLADDLRVRLSGDEFKQLLEHSSRRARRLERMDRGERLAARLPCAPLQNGCCSSYDSRPLVSGMAWGMR